MVLSSRKEWKVMGTALWIVGALAVALVVSLFVLGPWYQRWGATEEETTRALPGDDAVPNPDGQVTHAVTIHARPEDIFPWLVQMGYQRGGLYSYDWLDRLFGYLDRPSAERLLPEFQNLKVGDTIPIGRGRGFPVTLLVPNRALVLSGEEKGTAWSWQMALVPLDETHTRFLSRNRMRFPQTLSTRLLMFGLDLAAFLMTRKWMLTIKRRAEDLARQRAVLGVGEVGHSH
jgi:hypothetical protein